jgi:hypothetical protein
MAEVDPDQDAALRRLRTAFGFVEILQIIDHDQVQSAPAQSDKVEGNQPPSHERSSAVSDLRLSSCRGS